MSNGKLKLAQQYIKINRPQKAVSCWSCWSKSSETLRPGKMRRMN